MTDAGRESMLRRAAGIILLFLSVVLSVKAHPVPFSYLDIRVEGDQFSGSLVAHIVDLAHDLNIGPPESLLDLKTAESRRSDIREIIKSRLLLFVEDQQIDIELGQITALADRQALAFDLAFTPSTKPDALRIQCRLFPYQPEHQTFLNVYEEGKLVQQEIFSEDHSEINYYSGGRQDWWSVVEKFVPAGVNHIFTGPDHVLFIIGLLLIGGTMLRLLSIVTAFTIAHSITLSLAALNVVSPSPRLIEPAIALSIVYVGVDNLMVGRTGRDVRAWIAFFFGFVHGFGFASVLKEFGLPKAALGWSLFSFNLGVEIGQASIVLVVATFLAMLRSRSPELSRRVMKIGSVCVIVAGAFWFIQRVFF